MGFSADHFADRGQIAAGLTKEFYFPTNRELVKVGH
jgi:hypothetical protein